VPLWAVQGITFSPRWDPDLDNEIGAAIAQLGGKKADKAEAKLLVIGALAYPALRNAARHLDGEIQSRAKKLASRLKKKLPPELLDQHRHDVLETADSRITGKVNLNVLAAKTARGEELSLVTNELCRLRQLPSPPSGPPVLYAPYMLHWEYANRFGTQLAFTVTANANGIIYGTNKYTLVSSVAAAAVHAGVLRPGETGVVHLEIILPPASFKGSERNGVVSGDWHSFPAGAYRFLKSPKK